MSSSIVTFDTSTPFNLSLTYNPDQSKLFSLICPSFMCHGMCRGFSVRFFYDSSINKVIAIGEFMNYDVSSRIEGVRSLKVNIVERRMESMDEISPTVSTYQVLVLKIRSEQGDFDLPEILEFRDYLEEFYIFAKTVKYLIRSCSTSERRPRSSSESTTASVDAVNILPVVSTNSV